MAQFTGGIKFFLKSKCLFADGSDMVASSGDSSSPYALDRNPVTYWRSVSSNDLTVETLTLTFAESITIDRLLLVDHNWKQFTVKYFSGAAYANFAGVVGLDSSGALISETTFVDDTAYYEFTPVTTTSIQITVTKTQVANAEKYINQIIFTESLGTLVGYPQITGVEIDRNIRKKDMLSGKVLIQKSEESAKIDLNFANYPASLSADIDLIFSLHDKEENFMIWLCGGRRGTNYFKKQIRGFRLKDVYTVQLTKTLKAHYSNNIYKNTVNFTATFEEAVD